MWAAGQPRVRITVNNSGLSSLKYNGMEFAGNGDFRVNQVRLSNAGGLVFNADLNAQTSMDFKRRQLTRSYSWGSVKVGYAATGNRLNLTITTINNSNSTIQGVFYEPIGLKFPGKVQEYDGSIPMLGFNKGAPTLISMSYGSGVMVYANDDASKPLGSGFPFAFDRPANKFFPLRVNTDRDSTWAEFFPTINRPIAPGGTDQYRLSLRFGPAGSTVQDLAADVYQKFAGAFPQQLKWSDRRPIGTLFLATSATNWTTNPRGWFLDPSLDVTTAAGIASFKTRVLAFADNSIRILKQMNAQGMITWDIEGQQFPHATSYIGDPRQLNTLAPEMEGIADEYFQRFRSAGLRVGVCIRPQQLTVAPDGKSGVQQEVADATALLIEKIGYAKNRWGATLVYVDSNGGPNSPMDAGIFQKVLAAFPDILIMPEHENLLYYAYTAPYNELRQGIASTPAQVRMVYPNAFSVINTADGPIDQRYNDLASAVKQGDSLLYRSWFDDEPANSKVKNLYTPLNSNQ